MLPEPLPVPLFALRIDRAASRTASHRHACGQLYCLERGLLVVEDEHGRQALPPRQIAWIPPGHPHSAHSHGSLAGWSAYLAAEHCRDLPRHPGVLACSAFVALIVERATRWPTGSAWSTERENLLRVLLDELRHAVPQRTRLPYPGDSRLRRIAEALLTNPGDPRPAAEWARWAGLSSRSLSRLFGAETGMSFAQWRQLARLHAAVERLAAGQAVGEVAWSLGYESPSSFASAFRTVFGETPSGYSSRANEALALRAPQHGAVERIEAYFAGHGYDPHRHDTYAIGQTLAGVQSFRYRRSQRHSLPGGCLVLHPDELHDGEAGSQEGFRYRMLYVEPALIQQALGGRPLPFVRGGLSDDPRLIAASRALLQAMDTPLEPLEEQDALFELAHALDAVAGNRARGRRHFDFVAAERARQYIHAHLERPLGLDELAQVAQRERWSLSRDFRALFGTSPYRYLIQRRLDIARRLMLGGQTLAEAALAAGFTDQSHMTRHFGQSYGLPPARWLRMLGRA